MLMSKPLKEEIPYVKVTDDFMAPRRSNGGGMHDRGPISRQQTTDSDTSRRKPRSIRNELSECKGRGALARAHTAPYPGTRGPGRITRAIYDRRRGLRAAAGLSRVFSACGGAVGGGLRSHPLGRMSMNDFRVLPSTD